MSLQDFQDLFKTTNNTLKDITRDLESFKVSQTAKYYEVMIRKGEGDYLVYQESKSSSYCCREHQALRSQVKETLQLAKELVQQLDWMEDQILEITATKNG